MSYLFAWCHVVTRAAEEAAREETHLLSRHAVGLLLLPVSFARRACLFFCFFLLFKSCHLLVCQHKLCVALCACRCHRAGDAFVAHGRHRVLQLFPANLWFTLQSGSNQSFGTITEKFFQCFRFAQ